MIHLCIGEAGTQVIFVVLKKHAEPILLGTTFIKRFIRSTHFCEENNVPHLSPSILIFMVYDAQSSSQNNELDTCSNEEKGLALLGTPIMRDPISIAVA